MGQRTVTNPGVGIGRRTEIFPRRWRWDKLQQDLLGQCMILAYLTGILECSLGLVRMTVTMFTTNPCLTRRARQYTNLQPSPILIRSEEAPGHQQTRQSSRQEENLREHQHLEETPQFSLKRTMIQIHLELRSSFQNPQSRKEGALE